MYTYIYIYIHMYTSARGWEAEGRGVGGPTRSPIRMKRADPSFGVCPNSAWSPSYEQIISKIGKTWTIPSTGYY